MATVSENPAHRALAVRIVAPLEPDDRSILREYAEDLLVIRESNQSVARKAREALERTVRRDVARVFTSTAARGLIRVAWKDRTWAARLGLSAAALAAATTGTQGAGIAAFGTAIGVPLWVVLGAGGAFAGVLVDELAAAGDRPAVESPPEGTIKADYSLEESTDPEHILQELDADLAGLLEQQRFDEELGLETSVSEATTDSATDGQKLDVGAVWNRLLLRLRY